MSPSFDDARAPAHDAMEIEFDGGEAAAGSPPTPSPHAAVPDSGLRNVPSAERALPGLPAVWGGLLFLPAVVGLVWLSLPIVFRVESALKFPYQLDAEEGFLYLQALDLIAGRSIYTPVQEEPYLVGNYPPLYPMMIAAALRAGLEGLEAGRAVVALSTVLILLLLFGIARVLSGRWFVAFLAPLLFAVSYELYNWVAFCRVDLPALALTLLGAFLFTGFSSRGALVLAAVCFALAAYTRQTALMAPAACAVALVWNDRRGLVWFLTPYLAGGLGSFVVANLWLEGEFWRHLVEYNRNTMDWVVLRSILRNEIWFFYRWWIVALGVAGLGAGVWVPVGRDGEPGGAGPRREPGARRMAFAVTYFLLSAMSLSAFAKSGSAPNYALEPLAAASLLLVALLGRLLGGLGAATRRRRTAAWISTLFVAGCITLHVVRMVPISWSEMLPGALGGVGRIMDEGRVGWALFSSPNPDASEVARGDRIVVELQRAKGEVLSELPVFSIAAGHAVMFQPFIMSTLAREGRWDATAFVEDLRRGRFGVIVTTQDLREAQGGAVLARYTPDMAEAILERYQLVAAIPPGTLGLPYFIWRPRGTGVSERL